MYENIGDVKGIGIMSRGIEHHLHHPLGMPVPDVEPQPPGDGGTRLVPVQLFAFDLVGFDHILGQRLKHRLVTERKAQAFHPPDEATLPVADAGQGPASRSASRSSSAILCSGRFRYFRRVTPFQRPERGAILF